MQWGEMPGKSLRHFFWLTLIGLTLIWLVPMAIAMVPGPIEEDDVPPLPDPEPLFAPSPVEVRMPTRVQLGNFATYPEETYARCMSIGLPNRGALLNGVLFPQETPFYLADRPQSQWATPETVDGLLYAARQVQEKYGPGPRLLLGDISQPHGGRLRHHSSHQSGRDVDVSFYFRDGNTRFFKDAQIENIDIKRTWSYIEALVETNAVQYIFLDYNLQALFYNYVRERLHYPQEYLEKVFQYPGGAREMQGIIRHARGHRNHLHVRFISPIAIANARNTNFGDTYLTDLQKQLLEKESMTAGVVIASSTTTIQNYNAAPKGRQAYLGTQGQSVVYTVRDGDTLWSIAKRHGITVNQIRAWNGLTSQSRLRIGQQLTIYR